MIGDMLYLISNDANYDFATMEAREPQTFLPSFAENGNAFTAEPSDVVIPEDDYSIHFTVVSGIDTTGKGRFVSQKSVCGRNFEVFCARENLYLTAPARIEKKERKGKMMTKTQSDATLVTRISLDQGQIRVSGSAKAPGIVNDQFSMDEKDGVLRMVTTTHHNTERIRLLANDEDEGRVFDEFGRPVDPFERNAVKRVDFNNDVSNGLYTLDENLQLLGKTDNLAPDEEVYSCRFIGDYGYFVTFRQVDPLFSVDLSDPRKPKVLDKLKIPGFSEYLHPWSEGLLFGFGKDADKDTGISDSLKLSMFDNSNPARIREQDTLILKGLRDSEVSVNHKAILVNSGRNLIAFPADNSYLIYTWNQKEGFQKQTQMMLSDSFSDGYGSLRGLFIGDILYVVTPRTISCFDMKNDYRNIFALTYDEFAGPVERKSWESDGFQGIE
jgi:uncharacterized secreted protein with C-terminal beta-propeller domain